MISVACVLAAAPVAAQPAAPDNPSCAVTIARAPDDVRAVVEQWVRAEPQCNTALEVRIVPTQGGLYLLARDEHGRVRERVVPDAQSAGVLVASWTVVDAAPVAASPVVSPPAAPPAAAPAIAPMSSAVPAAPPASTSLPPVDAGAPGAPSATGTTAIVATAPEPAGNAKWLALGGMFAMSGSGGGGIRGELDLKTRRYLTLGVAASASTWGAMVYGQSGSGTLDTFDAKALGYASVNTRRGRWHFRAGLGAGIVYTRAMLRQASSREAAGVFPAGEVSLSAGREVTGRWQLYAGPIVSLYAQSYQFDEMGPGYYSTSQVHRDLEAMFLIGMRHQL